MDNLWTSCINENGNFEKLKHSLDIYGDGIVKSEDPGPRTWDLELKYPSTSGPKTPEPGTQNPGTQEPVEPWRRCLQNFLTFLFKLLNVKKISSHEVYYRMYSVCLVLFENDVLLLNVKIKHWKCKKLLTSKYDEAKYPFTDFSLIKFIGFFFLGLMPFFWNFPKDSRYSNPLFLFKSCIWMRSFFITSFLI